MCNLVFKFKINQKEENIMSTIQSIDKYVAVTSNANLSASVINKAESEHTREKIVRLDTFEMISSDKFVDTLPETYATNKQLSNSNSIYKPENFDSTSIPLSKMAANRAGIASTSSGSPIINSSADYEAYNKAMTY